MSIQVQLSINDRDVKLVLDGLSKRIEDATPVMQEIGEIIREGVMQSFREGRSPEGEAWKPSQRALRQRGKTLIDRAILRNSINVQAGPDSVAVGTPDVRASTHQFGAAAGSFGTVTAIVKAHIRRSRKGKEYSVKQHSRKQALPWGDIPARPFIGIREEDWRDIQAALHTYLIRKKG